MKILAAQNKYLDFTPGLVKQNLDAYDASIIIERAIIEGSGGTDNVPITIAGLRFIRYLLSLLPADDCVLPNLRNTDAIKNLANRFIRCSGSTAQALQNMEAIMNSIDCIAID